MENKELLELAKEAAHHAYVPYSKFKVGACALYESGNRYNGCNVENSSYGLTLCAERNAMSNAIVNGEKSKLVKIAIYSENTKMCMPCGACRQWIAEFKKDNDTQIILESDDGYKVYTIEELLPHGFILS